MAYLVYQIKRTQVSFTRIRKALELPEVTYTLRLLQGNREALRIEQATLGTQYLNSWTKMYDATRGKTLQVWRTGERELTFKIFEANQSAEIDMADLVAAAVDQCLRCRTGVPVSEEALPAVELQRPEIVAALAEASQDLDLGDLSRETLTDDEVLASLPKSWAFEGLEEPDVRARVAQRGRLQLYFRARMLRLFGGRCALCGCAVRSTLEAAHVFPWSRCESDAERIDDANGLLLCANHHRLFDTGDIMIGQDLVVNVTRMAGDGAEVLEMVRGKTVSVGAERDEDFKSYLARRA
ncbi:HNH endonuclease [Sorangium sp. So ce406]|uniref:HNH endonuclease n=1 Tax=Sorangium sp. So ce406 TaxID=3133311 RepID=UPI003F5C7A55